MLRKKIQDELIVCLKSGDKDKLSLLRLILSQIKNREIEKKAELNDEEVVSIIRKMVKELNESIDAFKKGNRADLVTEYKKQLEIVSTYLPSEISDDELKIEIQKIIAENKAVFDQNQKRIIGLCIGQLKAKADPSRIMKILSTFMTS